MNLALKIGYLVLLLMVVGCHPRGSKTEIVTTSEYRDLALRDSLRHQGRNRERGRHEGRKERGKWDKYRMLRMP